MNIKVVINDINRLTQTIAQLQSEIEDLNEQIATKDITISQLTTQVQTLNTEITTLETQITQLNSTIETQAQTISTLQAQITDLDSQITTLNNQITSLNAQITSLNQQIASYDLQINQINGETVSDPLTYLATTKSLILSALQNKGSSATSSTTFREYATEITKIPSFPPAETTLLLHLDSDNNLNDSSIYHRPILTCGTGTPTIVTTESKFGNGSLYLDGTCGLYVNQTNFYPFQMPEWTFECFFKPISWNTSTQYAFFGNRYTYHSGTSYEYDCWHRFIYYSPYEVFSFQHENISSTSTPLIKSYEFRASMPSEQWHHLAVVRNSLDPNYSEQYYLDGVALSVNTTAVPSMYNSQRDISIFHNIPAAMGLMCYNAQTEFNRFTPCYVNEIRFSSVCRYSTNFTPPTEPFSS